MWVVAGTRCTFETLEFYYGFYLFFFLAFLQQQSVLGYNIYCCLFNLSLNGIEVCTQNEFQLVRALMLAVQNGELFF